MLKKIICTIFIIYVSLPEKIFSAEVPIPINTKISIDPLNISVINNNKVKGILTLKISLILDQNTDASEIYIPKLTDKWITALNPYISNIKIERTIDVNMISQILQRVVNNTESKATVLITFVAFRSL